MKRKDNKITDPDLLKVEDALREAGLEARKIAFFTGTPLIYYQDGKIIRHYVSASELKDVFQPLSP